MTGRVLIVEDDPTMLRALTDNFRLQGYAVETATDGEAAYDAALRFQPEIIILDIMLPKVNGYEVCRMLREEGVNTPIIMLTAKGEESDIILGLNIGADDYVTKPFSIRQLLARAQALVRRTRVMTGDPRSIVFGDFRLDLDSRRLEHCGVEVRLTPKEYKVLALLARSENRAMTREQILREVWGHGVFVTTRSVDRCITTLRQKIEPDPSKPMFIKTVREIGYRFEVPPVAPSSEQG
ncbi:MAG: response regulator transcription factor [Acidobacteriota bacterium]